MKNSGYYKGLSMMCEGIDLIEDRSLLNEISRRSISVLEDQLDRKLPLYGFCDYMGLLDYVPTSTYSMHEKQFFSEAMQLLAENTSSNIYLTKCLNGTAADKYEKIDFEIAIKGKYFTVQFKTRSESSKRNFMEDITLRDTECSQGCADILVEVVFDESNHIIAQHYLNLKKLRDCINRTVLIDGIGLLKEDWKLRLPAWLGKTGENSLDLSVIRPENSTKYFYTDESQRLGLTGTIYVLPRVPNTRMVPFPIDLLKKLDIDLDNPNIFQELGQPFLY